MRVTVFQTFASVFLLLIGFNLFGQTPTTQDCLGAIPVCESIYVEDETASGHGNYNEIPAGLTCPDHCMDGEKNSRWYIFTVIESGALRFEITPQTPSDDYDWSVFNITTHSCDEIWDNPDGMLVSCNAAGGAGYQGATGVSTPNGGMVSCNDGGETAKWNADMQVWEGDTYVLVVSDWTQTPGGYTLDFSASSAAIFDDQNPYIDYVGGDLITACGSNEIEVMFNENVKCSSVQAGDFFIDGPGGPYTVTAVSGYNCDLGGANEREYILTIEPAIYQGGDFNLGLTLFSAISDACNNYAQSATFAFSIELESPVAQAGDDVSIAFGGVAVLDGGASGGSGQYTYAWEPAEYLDNPTMPNPTTTNLTTSTPFYLLVSDQESACQSQDTMWVNVVGGPMGIEAVASSATVCSGERVDLMANTGGGSGAYTYSWWSNPTGLISSQSAPSVFPEQDTWYIVEVTDGFSVLHDSVFVQVFETPVADAGPDQVINEGTITSLSGMASGGLEPYIWQWEPASWLEQNNVPNPTTLPLHSPTVFTLLISDAHGCPSDYSTMLVNPDGNGLSAFPLADPGEICAGEFAVINANATGGGSSYTYEWTSDPVGFSSSSTSIEVEPLVSTRYDLLVKDEFGNEFTAHTTVLVNPLPVINLLPDGYSWYGADTIQACVRDSVLLDAGFDGDPFNTEYYWLSSSYVNRTFTAQTTGSWIDFQTHAVQVTHGTTGCVNSDSVTVFFDFSQCNIDVPEHPVDISRAIQLYPNPNKGIFTLVVNETIAEVSLQVLDVRGTLLYTSYFSGKLAPGFEKEISLDGIQPGIYVVRIANDQGAYTQKMVVN